MHYLACDLGVYTPSHTLPPPNKHTYTHKKALNGPASVCQKIKSMCVNTRAQIHYKHTQHAHTHTHTHMKA